ncbi:MAG: flagellar basal body rod protein FlgC [Alphaproteobacteria bacterium]|nr:flagellar basal body rod protein FlgC [Alphaproteobacteria bacterium]
MDLMKSVLVSTFGMRAQGERMRVISENLANADSTAKDAESDPYRRKVVTFRNELDRAMETRLVKVAKVGFDRSEFQLRHMPGHPAADANGYVRMPNVNALIELADMREAQRSYEANMAAIDAAKGMISKTIDLLR